MNFVLVRNYVHCISEFKVEFVTTRGLSRFNLGMNYK